MEREEEMPEDTRGNRTCRGEVKATSHVTAHRLIEMAEVIRTREEQAEAKAELL